MVQLTSDSFPSGSFFLHHHEWILDFREVRFDPHQKSWTSLKCSRNRSAEDHMVSKNHLRNMVKENDTWQFSNWPFLISKSPTRSSPHEDSDWQPVHGGSVGTAPPTSFSCLCYRLENFLLLEINLLRQKKNKCIFAIWAYLSIKYPAGEVLVVERVQVGRLSNSGCEAMFDTVKLPWCPA